MILKLYFYQDSSNKFELSKHFLLFTFEFYDFEINNLKFMIFLQIISINYFNYHLLIFLRKKLLAEDVRLRTQPEEVLWAILRINFILFN